MKKNEIEYYMVYIREILPKGKRRAVHMQEIADRLNINPASVKNIVRKLRKMGVAICSDTNGYWIASNTLEMQKYTEREQAIALSKMQTVKALRNNKEIEGQISITDNDDFTSGLYMDKGF